MWVLVEPLVATSTNTTLLKDAVAVAWDYLLVDNFENLIEIVSSKKKFRRDIETKIHKVSFEKIKKKLKNKHPKLKIELKLISLNKKVERFN